MPNLPRELRGRSSFCTSLYPSTMATIYAAELTSRSNTIFLSYPFLSFPFLSFPSLLFLLVQSTHIKRLMAFTPFTETSKTECLWAWSGQADRTDYQIRTVPVAKGLVTTLISFHSCVASELRASHVLKRCHSAKANIRCRTLHIAQSLYDWTGVHTRRLDQPWESRSPYQET
jgi:hypothetical protein